MNTPDPTTSALYPVRLRQDLERDVASSYWAGPHAAIVTRLSHLMEYNQYHFSAMDHGYWPATPKVGRPPRLPGLSTGSPRCGSPAWLPRYAYRCTCARFSSTSRTSSSIASVTSPDRGAADGGRRVTTTRSVIALFCSCADAGASAAHPFARSFILVWGRL